MGDSTIVVDRVSKDFKLSHDSKTTLKSRAISALRFRHKSPTEIQHALKDISFDIKEGEFFGIVGRNGSGKSTLLKILAGIYQPNKGGVHIQGKLVPFIELGVGFNPELTGRENIYLNGAMLGFSKKEVSSFYDEVVYFAELENFMDKKLKNYSSGMQVRLAFSMAIQAKANILLIDEVLAVGDADFQRKCFEYFSYLKKTNTTVVFVSHDMDAIRKYCDRAVLIEKSRLTKIGSPDKVAQAYMKQFSDNDDVHGDYETGTTRWGDGGVMTESIEVKVATEHITINQKIMPNKDIESLIVGIRIRNSAGTHITGTNTNLEKIKVGPLKRRKSILVTWVIPNIFSQDKYYVDPSMLYEDGITTADWWDEAVSFVVKREKKLPYSVDPGFKIKIS